MVRLFALGGNLCFIPCHLTDLIAVRYQDVYSIDLLSDIEHRANIYAKHVDNRQHVNIMSVSHYRYNVNVTLY